MLGILACRRHETEATRIFPGKTWSHTTPDAAGMDAEKLAAFVEYVGGSGCIVRGGRMVRQWGHVDHPFDVASAVKPVYAHLLYMAIAEGHLDSLDSLVAESEPRLCDINADLDHKDKSMTWDHLVTQTACYGVLEEPGTAFDYSDYQSALLIDTLIHQVFPYGYDQVDEKIVEPLLAEPIGCEDSPTLFGRRSHPGRL
ncbi:MAG: serine hydrolase, partial [Verrucomicrobia bacterium]|nr:serine hydrolase [Verrucomicrobiota bacterium]